MQLQISKSGLINKFPVESDISSVTAPYLSFNNEYFLNLELSQEANGSNFKINNKYFKVIETIDGIILTDSYYKMTQIYPENFRSITEVPDKLNTDKVTNMSQMFNNCRAISSIPELNTNNVTNMKEMFRNCSDLTTIPELNTDKVENMNNMFYNCSKLTGNEDIFKNLNTSKVEDMIGMFASCKALTTIPQLDMSQATSIASMFNGCTNLTTIPQLDTSNVTNMNTMFSGCTSLPATFPWIIDCKNITNPGDNMGFMFYNSSVTKVTLANVKEELKSQITPQLLKNGSTIEIIFVNIEEPKKNIKSIQSITKSVDYNTAFNDLALPSTVTITLDDDSTTTLSVTWNSSSYNATESGIQYVSGTITLTDELTNTNNVQPIAVVEVAAQQTNPVNNDDWSLQFTLDTIQSEITLDNINGFAGKEVPSLEDFYGEEYDNVGRHLEVRYLGTQGHLDYAPDGVSVPNSCSSEEEIAAAINPDGYVDYDPDARSITFSGGSAGVKVYLLVYHSEAF